MIESHFFSFHFLIFSKKEAIAITTSLSYFLAANMSSISTLSSSGASRNLRKPSDIVDGPCRVESGQKAGENQSRVATEKDVDQNDNHQQEAQHQHAALHPPEAPLPTNEVVFDKVVQRKDPIANATIDDVDFTAEPINPHKRINPKKTRNEKDFTRLVAIGSITAKALMLDDIKRFATRVGIIGHRAFGKQKVCEAIVSHKLNPKKKDATKKKVVVVNRKHFINVLFDEAFLPKLATRGKSLNKDQMTDGLKTDELLFRDFIVLYNNKEDYNDDEHPELGVKGDPSSFNAITWEAARTFFRSLLKDYDGCLANWKKSGNHGGFGDNQKKPFDDFKKNRGDMLYLHEFAHQVPDVLKHVLTQLNADAFHESISDDDEAGTAIGSELAKLATSKKKRKQQTRKSSGNTVATAILKMSNDAKARNKAQKYAFVVETENNTSKVIREHRTDRKRVLSEASLERNEPVAHIKKKYKEYIKKKASPPKQTDIIDSLSDSDSDDSDVRFSQDSLESVFEELSEIDSDIDKAKQRQSYLRKEADQIENKENNNSENNAANEGD